MKEFMCLMAVITIIAQFEGTAISAAGGNGLRKVQKKAAFVRKQTMRTVFLFSNK